ncbi:MAG: hypothetical protein FWD09_00450 [Lentimicrobiaceae bacterium]|nr:hypothetical protein [Lentimicrobiaceae bacterium]
MIKGYTTFDNFLNENVNEGATKKYVLYSDEYIKNDDGLIAMLDKMILLICRGELKPIKIDANSYTIITTENNYNKLLSFAKLHKYSDNVLI